MVGTMSILTYLLIASGAAGTLLAALVIYGDALDNREDEEIYVNKTEQKVLAGDQPALIRRMNSLARVIAVAAVTTGVFLLASAGVWVWIELYRS